MTTPYPLISASELSQLAGEPNHVFLDATTLLPGEKFDPVAEFGAGHIPGAVRFDIELFSAPDTTLPHMVPSAERYAGLIGELGISREHVLVFYDQKGVVSASRAWWLATLFGHKEAYILDGGLPAWVAHGGALEIGPSTPLPAATYRVQPRYVKLCGLGDMLDLVSDGGAVILDARSRARFVGEVAEPRPGVRSGHMPGATSLPYGNVLDENNHFLKPEALQALFDSLGVTDEEFVVTSCGSGLTASVLTVALTLAGFDYTALYDGSWAEWGSTPDAPIETGVPA